MYSIVGSSVEVMKYQNDLEQFDDLVDAKYIRIIAIRTFTRKSANNFLMLDAIVSNHHENGNSA